MEFVTFDGLRFPIKFLDGRPYAQDDGGKYRVVGTYDPWVSKPKTFRIHIDGESFLGRIRVTAGSRQASRWITIGDLSLILHFRRAINRGQRVESFSGIEYRYAAIAPGGTDEFGYPTFRVRLDPV